MYLYGVFKRAEGTHYGSLACYNQRSTPALFHHVDKATEWRNLLARSHPDNEYIVHQFSLDPNAVRWDGVIFT